jgi:Rieske Fe-S protein
MSEPIPRRTALSTLLRGTCALAALGACGPEQPLATVLPCGPTPGSKEEGWVEVRLKEYPALREPGGSAAVRLPEALLDVLLLHTTPGCFAAVWRICTHGDCAVDYVPQQALLECPCHGSRFDEEGQVLRGPATRPLAAFPATQVGDSVWIHRPR